MKLVLLGNAERPHLLKWARALDGRIDSWAASSRGLMNGFDAVLPALRRLALGTARVLDVGCGPGVEFANLLRWCAGAQQLFGVDLMLPQLRAARERSIATHAQASAAAPLFADASFNRMCLRVVFISIVDDALRRAAVGEMQRVPRPGGYLLWYETTRTRSPDTHFKPVPGAAVERLFPGVSWRWQRVSTDPGLLRHVVALLGEPGVQALGVSCTHLLGLGQRR